jgi:hypothetical protein
MQYYIYLIIVIFVVFILATTKPHTERNARDESMLAESVGWIMFIYSLILGFSITIFYERYVEIRDSILALIYDLETITEYFINLKGTDEILKNISEYSKEKYNDLKSFRESGIFPNDKTKFNTMRTNITRYIIANENLSFGSEILDKISHFQKIDALIDEINSGQYYVGIILFMTFFVYIMLWFNTLTNDILEIIAEISISVIIFTAIYLCDILNDPISDSPVGMDINHLLRFTNGLNERIKNKI